ncbi:MAG: hypothetical protein KBF31_05505 [Chitinophagales bacterium]|nr:hypothetical protein [Chitinophagales bacterium]
MHHYFYNTIYQLRTKEEIILYDKLFDIKEGDEALVKEFLQIEFNIESKNHPFSTPKYDAESALWAAKIVYTACQILLYREHKEAELTDLLPAFTQPITTEAILSADLCLRFLPQILAEAKLIDPEDYLIPILESILNQWHYSGIGIPLSLKNLDFELIFSNPCLEQLYIDRVIDKKDKKRAELPQMLEKIRATLGNYTEKYWNEFKKSD